MLARLHLDRKDLSALITQLVFAAALMGLAAIHISLFFVAISLISLAHAGKLIMEETNELLTCHASHVMNLHWYRELYDELKHYHANNDIEGRMALEPAISNASHAVIKAGDMLYEQRQVSSPISVQFAKWMVAL